MKTSSGIMNLLGKPEWRWRNWRWTRRKTSTCVSRELSLWVKLDYIQTTLCSPCLNLLLTCCNLVPPHRQRELQPPGEPEASLSTKMRQCFFLNFQACLNMADSCSSSYKSYHESHWTIFTPPPPLLRLSRGKMAERWRSAVGFWCPSCTTPRRTASSWVSCAAFTWLPWMLMATLTLMSKCR